MFRQLILITLSLLAFPAGADVASAPGEIQGNASKTIKTSIGSQLKKLDPDIPIVRIDTSPVTNLYAVSLEGGQVFHTSPDGNYLIRGDMLEINSDGKLVNLTSKNRSKNTAEQLSRVSPDDMIIFAPKGETRGVVYAFTDIECGFCKKLHQEIEKMNELGIELRYLAYPRGGKSNPAYDKMVSVWCADDRKAALTSLSMGQEIPKKSCKNPIDAQLKLGTLLGVSGTPALFLEDGRSLPGYRPAKDLARILKITPPPEEAETEPPSEE